MNPERANTVEEFKAKYGGKRYTSHTAGKAPVIELLYHMIQVNEQGGHGITKQLYQDMNAIKAKVDNVEDMNLYNAYLHLLEWNKTAYDATVMSRNALKSAISDFSNITKTIIAAENLRREVKESPSESFTLWLSTITIEAYTPQRSGFSAVQTLRRNIEQGIRYVHAYNSFVEIIAKAIEIPEYNLLQVSTASSKALLLALNEALTCLREDVAMYRGAEISAPEDTTAEDVLSDLTRWTPDYLKATMASFSPVEIEPPPIPEEFTQVARSRIRRDFHTSFISWGNLFTSFASPYWRLP